MPADIGFDQRERRFRQLYAEHYRPVWAYAVRRLDSAADVADVVAEVFTTAWRRLDDVPAAPEAGLWLYGVARRVLAGHHRSSRRRRRLMLRMAVTQVSSHHEAPDLAEDELILALRQIPDGEREALMLTAWEQLSHAEAAQVLGCSPNAVAIRVHRAKSRLREALTDPRPDNTPVITGGNHGR